MRIKKDHQREMLWSFIIKFSQLLLQGNVSRLVWRISVPDPDREIRGWDGHPDPKVRGGGGGAVTQKKFFCPLGRSLV